MDVFIPTASHHGPPLSWRDWQRDALRRLVQKQELAPQDIEDLYAMLKFCARSFRIRRIAGLFLLRASTFLPRWGALRQLFFAHREISNM